MTKVAKHSESGLASQRNNFIIQKFFRSCQWIFIIQERGKMVICHPGNDLLKNGTRFCSNICQIFNFLCLLVRTPKNFICEPKTKKISQKPSVRMKNFYQNFSRLCTRVHSIFGGENKILGLKTRLFRPFKITFAKFLQDNNFCKSEFFIFAKSEKFCIIKWLFGKF